MGMIVCLRRSSDETIEKLIKNPDQVEFYLFGEEIEEIKPFLSRGLFGFILDKLQKKRPKKKSIPGLEYVPEDEIDLDKAWHAIYYILTGQAEGGKEPFNYLLEGGVQIGDDFGYGPARAFSSEQAKGFYEILKNIDKNHIKDRFDLDDMKAKKIYVIEHAAHRDPAEELLEYVTEYFMILKAFMERTVKEQKGIVIYIS